MTRHHTVSPSHDIKVTGRFAPSSVRPLDVSPPRRFAPWTFRHHAMDDSPPWLENICLWCSIL